MNLLTALEVLLTERNVTRAAARLNLSQSAASSALARLREQFCDELLVAVGRDFLRTKRADALLPKVRAILSQIETSLIQDSLSNPAEAQRLVRVMASDYVSLTMLSSAFADIAIRAPGLRFEVIKMEDNPSAAIENYEVDLLITPDMFTSQEHPSQLYFEDDYVGLTARENVDFANTTDVEKYFSAPHVVVRFQKGGAPTHDDRYLEQLGKTKTVCTIVPSHALVPYFLVGAERIATVQRRQAEIFASHFPLRIFELPIEIPPIRELFQWHASNDGDAVLEWVRTTLLEAADRGERPLADSGVRAPAARSARDRSGSSCRRTA